MAFKTNSIGQVTQLHKQLQEIEREISLKPTNVKACNRLFHKLEETSHSLGSLKAQTEKTQGVFLATQQEFCSELEGKIVYLFGRVIDAKVDCDISKIQAETVHLQKTLQSGTSVQISKELALLQKHIQKLLSQHRPSKDNLSIIAEAKKTVADAQNQLEGHISIPRHFDWIASKQAELNLSSIESTLETMPEEIDELFAIAQLLHNNKYREARAQFHQLPQACKDRIEHHIRNLGGNGFELITSSIQAVIATAYDVAGRFSEYLTSDEIEELFRECQDILQEGPVEQTPSTIRLAF